MPEFATDALTLRYVAYRRALIVLASDHTTVAERKELLRVRDQFEADLRDGLLDPLFGMRVVTREEKPRA